MKFAINNKKEILAVLSETEKKIADIRFLLTKLPQEFEIVPIYNDTSTDETGSPARRS